MTRGFDEPSDARRSRWRVVVAGAVAAVIVAGCGAQGPGASSGGTPAQPAVRTMSPAGGFSPQTLQRAYGVSSLLREGIDGRGETVVLPEDGTSGAGTFNIRQNLVAFDTRDHLPRVQLTLSRALRYTGGVSRANPEEVLDAEMVHAIAPGAKINIMLVGSITTGHLASLLRASTTRGNIISLSYSECERCLSAAGLRSVNRALELARDRHVSVLAAAGDSGPAGRTYSGGPARTRGVALPASSPLVTGVGGTRLVVDHDGMYSSESVWHAYRFVAGSGGVSARYARPGYQHGLPVIGDHRGVPDVAAVADPGLAQVLIQRGHQTVGPAGGTSAATPLWAGIAALADQDARRQLGFLNQGLYRIAHSPMYHRAFHDITHGNNTVTLPSGKRITGYRARPGWDPASGWGSPNAQVLVPLLATEVHPGDGQGL